MSETSGLSAAGQKADAALKLLIEARRDCVDPAELERINHAITAAHMVIESPSDPAVERELRVTPSDREALDEIVAEGPPDGWQGTHPAPGTRRALILDTIREHDGDSDEGQLELADAIESALLQSTIDAEAMERGAEALTDGIEKVEPEDEDEEGKVTIAASDGTSIGSLDVVLGAQDGVPYVSLVDLEHVFANLYEDITERQARRGDQAEPVTHRGGEEPPPESDDRRPPDEWDIRTAACERLHERLVDGPLPNPAELARVIDILR